MTRKHFIPANYPYGGFVYLKRKDMLTPGAQEEVITEPVDVPGTNWQLHLVDNKNDSYHHFDLDWSRMSESGRIPVMLSAADTAELAGLTLHLEIRNDTLVSDLYTVPEDLFIFVPNNI